MRSVVIVAGGTGSRMQSEIPKQFLEILGKPVIVWTIEKFISFDSQMQIVVVLPESHMLFWQDIIVKYPQISLAITTSGGISRFHSVMNGLSCVNSDNLVGIHDAVRPLVSIETLERCYEEAQKKGSAIPVIPVEDSLRTISKTESSILDRSSVVRIQTPQVFPAEKIINAYTKCLDPKKTDDASVYESYYGQINLVEGNKENLKITFPADIKYAEMLLRDNI
jgi:2-C-methyl-D-erythritol 4-phosphate cytidylyltransferase